MGLKHKYLNKNVPTLRKQKGNSSNVLDWSECFNIVVSGKNQICKYFPVKGLTQDFNRSVFKVNQRLGIHFFQVIRFS